MSRFHLKPVAAAVAAAAALGLAAAVGGGVWALWRSEVTVPAATVAVGQVYVDVTRGSGSAAVKSVATADEGAGLAVSAADAVTVVAETAGLAIPFDVNVAGDGHTGLDYSLVLPAAVKDSVAEASQFQLFRRDGDSCSAADVPADAFKAVPGDKVGPFPGASPGLDSDQLKTDAWCLVLQLDATKLDTYSNQAEATATGAGKSVTAKDSWSALVTPPRPETNEPFKISLEPLFTRPNTPARPAPTVTHAS